MTLRWILCAIFTFYIFSPNPPLHLSILLYMYSIFRQLWASLAIVGNLNLVLMFLSRIFLKNKYYQLLVIIWWRKLKSKYYPFLILDLGTIRQGHLLVFLFLGDGSLLFANKDSVERKWRWTCSSVRRVDMFTSWFFDPTMDVRFRWRDSLCWWILAI